MRYRKGFVIGLMGLAGLFALAQAADPLNLQEGFFGSVLGYVEEGLLNHTTTSSSSASSLSVTDTCARQGIPTSLQVNTLGTTRSPFCPGQAEARATAWADRWTVSVNESAPGQEVIQGIQVRSGGIAYVRVEYKYAPPEPPESFGGSYLRIEVDHLTGEFRFYYNGVEYGPSEVSGEQMQSWIESTGGWVEWLVINEDGTRQSWATNAYTGECTGDCP